jgi:hypothetical protein
MPRFSRTVWPSPQVVSFFAITSMHVVFYAFRISSPTHSSFCAAATLHSLALSGLISHTGVGGLTLGGGVGFTSRLLGLTCDALVGARVVTSSGKVVVVDERTHSDLFWVKPQRIVRMTLFRAHGCSCNASSMPCDT